MPTGTQNLLHPSTLGDPAASASGVCDRRPAVSPLAGRSFRIHIYERGPRAGRKPGSFQASSAVPLVSRTRHVTDGPTEWACSLVIPPADSQTTFPQRCPSMPAFVRDLG